MILGLKENKTCDSTNILAEQTAPAKKVPSYYFEYNFTAGSLRQSSISFEKILDLRSKLENGFCTNIQKTTEI